MPIDEVQVDRRGPKFFHNLEFEGRSQTIAAWALEKNIPVPVLYQRVREGWDVEKALTTPADQDSLEKTKAPRTRKAKRIIEWKGKSQGLCAWSRELGLDQTVLQNRLRDGWSIDEAFTTPVLPKGTRRVTMHRISHPDYVPPPERTKPAPVARSVPSPPPAAHSPAPPLPPAAPAKPAPNEPPTTPEFLVKLRQRLAELDALDGQIVVLQARRVSLIREIEGGLGR